ncbi:MAG: SRPBCC domain-containing protein [Dermatophilaceae bacterium]
MTTTPTSPIALRRNDNGTERLVFTRVLAASVDDVWAACTEPARMERWIGTWTGNPSSGQVVFRMTAEGEDVPAEVWLVEECRPPHRFAVRSREERPFSEDGSDATVPWVLTLELAESGGRTTLTFTQEVASADVAASVGPGWDYYLDRLVTDLGGGDVALVSWESHEPRSVAYRALFG